MKQRSFIWLGALALVSIIVAGYALWQSNVHHNLTVDRTLFPDLVKQTGDVTRIEISGDGKTITLQQVGRSWLLPQKDNYPADGARIERLVSILANLTLVEKKTADPARYAELKLEAPGKDKGAGTEIKLFDAHDTVLADAVIGRTASNLGRVGDGFYARRVDEAPSWLVEGAIDVPTGILEWANATIFDLYDPNAIRTAGVMAGGKPVVTVTRDKPNDDTFQLSPTPPGKTDQGKALRLITLPVSLPFDDVRAAPASDLKPLRSAVFKSFSGTEYRLTVYDAGTNIWVRAQENGSGDMVKRFNEFHAKWFYKLPPYRSELLLDNLPNYSIKDSK